MKAGKTLLAIGVLGIIPTLALAQSTNADLTVSASKIQLKPVYPAMEYKLEKKSVSLTPKSDKIERHGKMSSLPWTEIVARQQSRTDVHDAKIPETALCLSLVSF